jgi:hypothetical protein
MPVLAIGAAALSLGLGGAAAIGGVIAGTATLATTLAAVATVGAVVGAVGAVTHDKTLSTIGMALGAVGGVGALAANAGLFGEAATTSSLFGTASEGVQAADIAGEVPALSSSDLTNLAAFPNMPGVTDGGASALSLGGTGAFDASGVLPTSGLQDATSAASGDANGLINSAGPNNSIKNLVSDDVDPATNTLVKGGGGGSAANADQNVVAADAGLPSKGSYVGETATTSDGTPVSWNGSAWAKQPGFFSGLMKSPMAQYGAIQAAGSLVGGMFDPLKPAQVDALNAQSAANRATAAQTSAQNANMAAPLPVASRAGNAVTGAPTGLINQPAPAIIPSQVAA